MIYNDKTREELLKALLELEKKYEDLNSSYEKTLAQLTQANKTYQEKEDVYRTLFDTSNDAVFIMEDDKFIDCNSRAFDLFKCTETDLIGKTPLHFSPEYQTDGQLSLDSAREKVKQAVEGTPQIFEWIHQKADGELFDAEVSLFRIFIKNKPFLQAIVRDISYRTKSEENYKMLIDFASDAFFQGDKDGRFLLINKKAVELTGFSKEELNEMAINDLFLPESLENKPLRYDLLKEGKSVKSERVLVRKSGEYIPIEMYSRQMPDGTFQSFIRDISDRKLFEKTMIESEERYRSMVEDLPVGVIIHQDSKIVFTNPISLNILKATDPDQVLGKSVFEFVHPDYHKVVIDRIKGSLEDRTKQEVIEEVFLTIDKENIYVNAIAMPLQYNGNPAVMVVAIDITQQKLIDLKLKESEERKNAILDAIPDLMLVMDKNGVFIDYNKDEDTYFIPPDQFLGKDISEIFPDEISVLTHLHLAKLFETGKMQVFNYQLNDASEVCYYESRLVMHGTEKALAIIRDITRQKKSEDALMESEERYRNMLYMLRLITDNAKDFLWAKDLDNKYIFANKIICERLLNAKDTEEPIGKTDLFFALRERESHPNNPEWHTFGEICANTDLVIHEEKKTKQFDEYGNVQGKFLFLDVNKSPIWDNNGNMIGVVGTGRDVTKEKELEKNEQKFIEALIESENRYRTVVSNTPIISFVVDSEGIFSLSDGKGLIKLGLEPGQIVGMSVYEIYKDYPIIIESIKRCLSGKSIREELMVDGIVFDVFYSPIFDNDGSVAKVIGVATDITERKQFETLLHEKNVAYENQNVELKIAKEKAEESDRLKSSFLANLSHEIRTPMNAILGFTDLLKKPEFTPDRRESFISIIHKSGNYLLSIINDIVEISKIDAGQVSVGKSSVEINSLLEEMHQSINITIPKDKNVRLEIQFPEKKLTKNIMTDAIKLRQILINLINNALKFTEEGYVRFGYHTIANNEIHFFVEDTGIGIDKKHHTIIFERFRQIEGDTAIKKGGSGLGLAISRAYAEMLGGKLSFTSEPQKGSIFRFFIPLEIEEKKIIISDIPEKVVTQKKSSASELILVVEDDDINYYFFEELFSETNYKIHRAKDGIEAVEMSTTDKNIKLVLMDIKLPKMNGYEALRKIREIRPDLPVVAQTSYALYDDVVRINQAGFDGYISKPIMKDKMLEVIKVNINKKSK